MQRCLDIVSNHLSKEHKRASEQALTLDELMVALQKIVHDKTSRMDRFPCEFYKAT